MTAGAAAAAAGPQIRSLRRGLAHALKTNGRVLVVGGEGLREDAGLDSPPGWGIGGTYYDAGRMATRVSFKRMWWEVWAWYAWRAATALRAEPCSSHSGVVDLLGLLGPRAAVAVTTSDGLLRRAAADAVDAGNRLFETQLVEINGNVTTMKCNHPQSPHPHEEFPLPELESVRDWTQFADPRARRLTEDEVNLLKCPLCMHAAKPNERFLDDDAPDFAASTFLASVMATPSLLLLVGCQPSALTLQLVNNTRANGGWVVRVNSPINPPVPPADPANAMGHTGIRAGDSAAVGDVHARGAAGRAAGLAPDDPSLAAHIGLQMAQVVDAAEDVVAEFSAIPPSYRRLSVSMRDA